MCRCLSTWSRLEVCDGDAPQQPTRRALGAARRDVDARRLAHGVLLAVRGRGTVGRPGESPTEVRAPWRVSRTGSHGWVPRLEGGSIPNVRLSSSQPECYVGSTA